jgi:hypothetical protein
MENILIQQLNLLKIVCLNAKDAQMEFLAQAVKEIDQEQIVYAHQ